MGKWTKYIRRYCIEWETDPRLKDWLRPLPGEPTKAYCRFCRAVLRAHHSDLLVHTGTRKHIRNTAAFLTSCKLKSVGDSNNESIEDGRDTHLCGKCGTRFTSLSSFIYHKVEEEGYRLFYAPSERNKSLILPNLLEDSNESIFNNSLPFPDTPATGQKQPEVTSVSVTVASLPETFSDDGGYIDTDEETDWDIHVTNGHIKARQQSTPLVLDTPATGQKQPEVTSVSVTVASLPETFSDDGGYIDTNEETDWDIHVVNGRINDNKETNEGENNSDDGDKVREFFACCFCEKLFDTLKHAQVHLASSHQAVIDGDGELGNDAEDGDVERDAKEAETDVEECEEDYECSSCGAKFKKLSILKAHQLTHTDVRIYACTYPNCTYSFKTKGSLERHMRRHTGATGSCTRKYCHRERPYVCNLCGRKFAESGVLTRHLKSQVPCTMKTDAEIPRYGKPLKMSTDNEQTNVNLLGSTCGNGLNSNNNTDLNTDSIEMLTKNISDEETNFTVVKENMETSENLAPDNASPVLILPDSLPAMNQLEHKCSACHKNFESLEELKKHLILHLSSESFHCNVCDYMAKDEIDLIEHHNKQHSHYSIDSQDETQFPPEVSVIVYKDILENCPANTKGISKVAEKQLAEISLKDAINTASEPFTCIICKKIFKSSVYFRLHMKMHENCKRFRCTVCARTFELKDTLRKHMKSHSKSKFMCSMCGKMYKTVSHAKEHMRAHTTDRPFVCSLCDKGFKSRNGLRVHCRTHTDEYPFSCSYCECRFREKPALIRHTRTHTGEKPFACKHCGRCFAEHGTLNRHLKAKVPCTAQRKNKKSESDAVISIQSEYKNSTSNAVDIIQEADMGNSQSISEPFPNLTSAEGQYIIASGDDKGILPDAQLDVTGTITVSDFEGLNAGSYVIISQSDGTSEAIVAEFPIENVAFVPETGEDIELSKGI